RHSRPPEGVTSMNSPRSSKTLYGFSFGPLARIRASLSIGIGGIRSVIGDVPLPSTPSCGKLSTDSRDLDRVEFAGIYRVFVTSQDAAERGGMSRDQLTGGQGRNRTTDTRIFSLLFQDLHP